MEPRREQRPAADRDPLRVGLDQVGLNGQRHGLGPKNGVIGEAGCFEDAANIEHMKKDSDLDSLRSRDDYKKLVEQAQLVVDSRGATRTIDSPKIVRC